MRRIITALTLWVAAGQALAEDVTHFTLDNGLEVVVITDARAPVATHMLWYKAGSADEPQGKSGVAHFLEHLMFKATDTLDAGEFSSTVAANGGSDNAFTSYDYTGYFQRVAADRLGLMMQMEANRMNNLALTDEDIRTEGAVIIEERNQRTENSPGALAGEQFRAAQFLNHRYGVPIIGWMHEMSALTMADVQAFYASHYAPNNAILVVAGDVTPDEVRRLAETHYGPLPAEDIAPRNRPAEPPQRGERRIIYDDPRVSQPYLVRSYLAPERDPGAQEKAAALVYLAELLGGSSFTSDLGRALQFDSQTALYTAASYSGNALDDVTFSIVVAPSPDVSLSEAEAAMDQVIADFLTGEIADDRMESIRTQLRASEIYARDDTGGIARRYGAALTQGLTVADVQAWPELLQAVSADQVKAVAAELFDIDRAVTGWVVANREDAK